VLCRCSVVMLWHLDLQGITATPHEMVIGTVKAYASRKSRMDPTPTPLSGAFLMLNTAASWTSTVGGASHACQAAKVPRSHCGSLLWKGQVTLLSQQCCACLHAECACAAASSYGISGAPGLGLHAGQPV
jgi:hypothetical protein